MMMKICWCGGEEIQLSSLGCVVIFESWELIWVKTYGLWALVIIYD